MKTFSLNKIFAIFALLFLIGGGKTLARDGQTKTLPITNYSPNNSMFFADFSIDWTTQKLQVVVDVTACNDQSEESGDSNSRPDCIFDLCPQTTSNVGWNSPTPLVHVYCDGTTVSLHGLGFASDDPAQKLTLGSSYDKTNITIEIDNENGLTIDGNSTSLTATFLTALFNKSNLTIASQEGNGRMAGTYKSVKVVSKTASSEIITSTNETMPEHVFTMRNANNNYVNSNLYCATSTSDYAQFAFYEVSGKTNAYYIYNYSAKKWLKYTTSTTYTAGKDFVSNGEKSERSEFYITDAAKGGVSGVQIQPYNAAGNAANNYLNFYGGGGDNTDHTIGNWTDNGSSDAGSLWVFTEVEIANNNAVITSTTIPTGTATNLTYNGQTTWKATKNTPWEITTPIDWNTQQLIVTVDLDGVYAKDAEANRMILCVTGADDELGWTLNTGRSVFYNQSATKIQGYVLEGDNANTDPQPYTNPLVFRYTKDGLYLGNTLSKHNATCLSKLLSQKNIKIGVDNEGCSGTYTIQLASNDYAPAQTYADNILRETATVSFNSQNNVDVQLERTLSPTHWNSFCVPFAISEDVIAEKFGAGTQVCTFGSMNGNVMNFAYSTSIEAGKPYIVKPTQEVVNPSFTGVNIEATAAKKVGADGYFMQGIYSAKTDLTTDGTNLFLGEGNKFYKPSGATTAKMKGMRAFFIVPQGTNLAALRANIDGATTAIDELTTVVEQPTDNRIYNLQGQFVGTSFEGLHGVYVQNGKKVLVK